MIQSKNGSLNLSIQAIVIVVIAFVVLGLGLTFVQNTFKDIGGTSKEVQAKVKEQILEQMRTSGKKSSMSSVVQLERGKQTLENVGIVNTGISTKTFGMRIIATKKQKPDGTAGTVAEMQKEIIFFYTDAVNKKLAPTAGDVIPVTITAKSSAAGNYLYSLEALTETTAGACKTVTAKTATLPTGCEAYDTRTFFVKIS